MKELKKIGLVSITVSVVIHVINVVFFYKIPFLDALLSFKSFSISLLYSGLISIACASFFSFLYKKISWEEQGVKNLLWGVIGSIVVVMPTYFLCRIIHIVGIERKYSFEDFIANESIVYYGFPLVFTIAVSLFFQAIGFYKAYQEKKLNEQKIIAGTASAKFDALRNQLDPHFLFNSLNVLTSLIEENPNAARGFTTSLSKVYRYVLEQKNKDLVSVNEELVFAKTYMSLLQMRFEDSIELLLPEQISNPEAKIVPLSLQLLLENTVKHNVVMPSNPLKIKIYEEAGFLYVVNNLQPKKVIQSDSGVGLSNITQRYALLTNRLFSVRKTRTEFIAKLPMLTKKITAVMEPITPISTKENRDYQKAKEYVENIKGFYFNLISYCVVIPGLAIFNHYTSPHFYWFLFPMFGWGLGVILHGFHTFNSNLILGKNWEERKMREFMEKDNF
ncbi:2TM domain-containing protein [Aquimarina agarilytica]|uniref:2TM domain-containing protein n=1 Tax=Aquimarina agarilytica TaxID=1087449 RepID=UPI0002894863|nr:2TM domain-containing protein [Aquimarina agarilytica]